MAGQHGSRALDRVHGDCASAQRSGHRSTKGHTRRRLPKAVRAVNPRARQREACPRPRPSSEAARRRARRTTRAARSPLRGVSGEAPVRDDPKPTANRPPAEGVGAHRRREPFGVGGARRTLGHPTHTERRGGPDAAAQRDFPAGGGRRKRRRAWRKGGAITQAQVAQEPSGLLGRQAKEDAGRREPPPRIRTDAAVQAGQGRASARRQTAVWCGATCGDARGSR